MLTGIPLNQHESVSGGSDKTTNAAKEFADDEFNNDSDTDKGATSEFRRTTKKITPAIKKMLMETLPK